MSILDGTEPIHDDELLYRRIPVSMQWYDLRISPDPSPESFRPLKHDTTGLSVTRAKYCESAAEAARGPSPQGYYVAVLRARDLRSAGIEVRPKPVPGNPGHAELPALHYDDRRSDRVLEWKVLLARKLCLRVEGPFSSLLEDREP